MAYSTIPSSWRVKGAPVSTRLINQIHDNLEDLNSRVMSPMTFSSVSSSTTLAASVAINTISGNTASGNITTTLPSAASAYKGVYFFKKLVAANTWTIAAAGGQYIDSDTSLLLTAQWETVAIVSDGTKWLKVTWDDMVTGPNASTTSAICRFDGTSGKIIKNSSTTIDDNGNMIVPIANGATTPTYTFYTDTDTGLSRYAANQLALWTGNTVRLLITDTGLFNNVAGSNSAPSYSFNSDSDSGIYSIGANNIGIAVNATKILDIKTTGLVIVGDTTTSGGFISSSSGGYTFTGDSNTKITNPTANNIALIADGYTTLLVKDTGVDITGTTSISGVLTLNANTNTYSFPTGRGTAGYVLTTDGSGGTTWETFAETFVHPANGTYEGGRYNGSLTGNWNVGIGYTAGYALTTGFANSSYGYDALRFETTGTYNVAIGYKAAYNQIGGDENIAIGYNANYNMTGDSNVSVGARAGENLTSGIQNVLIGNRAGFKLGTSASRNVCLGYYAGLSDATTSAVNNSTAIGYYTLKVATGTNNTAVGYQAGMALTTGTYNTLVGASTVIEDGASYSTCLGNGTTCGSYSGCVVIGCSSTGTSASASASNEIVLGTSSHKVIIKGTMQLANGTKSNPTLVFAGATAKGFYYESPSIKLSDGSDDLFVISTSTGSVTIGAENTNGVSTINGQVGIGEGINGKVGFFGYTPQSRTEVTNSAITFRSDSLANLASDCESLQTKVNYLIDVLQSYGLV